MDLTQIIILIIVILLVSGALFGLSSIPLVSYIVYSKTLKRIKGHNWGRQISEPGNEDLEKMWDIGIQWSKENQSFKKDVEISNDGLKLIGEFYDFGFDNTVIIMPGRRECLMYSYFYAIPYKNAEVNVLVIDQRAHGLSEGTYSTCGILEAKDVISWCNYLKNSHSQKGIFLHGVCVGSCCSANVIRDNNCPDFIKGIIFDSAFINYKEIYGKHMLELGHHLGVVFQFIWIWFKHFTGCNINDSSPLKFIDKDFLPSCFIWGRKDVYCLPEKSEMIWQKCPSKSKEKHFFEEGTHSKLRLHDSIKYDEIVTNFVKKYK